MLVDRFHGARQTDVSTSGYSARHAELYDLFYADKPYAVEADFVHECLTKFQQEKVTRLLDLACGTGGHAFEFERLGYEVVGVDHSLNMLARANQKARERSSSVRFEMQSMSDLHLGEEYDAVTCLFNSIGYLISNEEILKAMSGIHAHLRPHGLFIFEFWHAPAMLTQYEPLRIRRLKTDSEEILRISETEIDVEQQTASVRYEIYEFGDDQRYSKTTECHVNRFFSVQELSALLLAARFEPLRWFAGFREDPLLTPATWRVLAVSRAI
jgi:SAM-dependent methyltransferase